MRRFLAVPATRPRPLSPHLQIYRPQLTSVLSIFHRATGLLLVPGTLLLSLWVILLALGEGSFSCISLFVEHLIGRLLLLAWLFSLYYHLCNGIRHLAWDLGYGYAIGVVYRSGFVVVVTALGLTLATAFWAQ